MKLSRVERWTLVNQYRILEALYPADAVAFAEKRKVLKEGYELEYSWLCQDLCRDEDCMSAAECREVLDILDMFRAIRWTMEAEEDKSWSRYRESLFPGFDGNYEGKQLSYALHLRDQEKYMESFKELFGDAVRVDINSHAPMLPAYRAMLKAWHVAADRYHLTATDIDRIRSAGESASSPE